MVCTLYTTIKYLLSHYVKRIWSYFDTLHTGKTKWINELPRAATVGTHTRSSFNPPGAADDLTSKVDDVTSSAGSLSEEVIVCLFFSFFRCQKVSGWRETRTQAISATTLLWRNVEVVNCLLITMTSQVLMPLCLCEDLRMCCQAAVCSLHPPVTTRGGSWTPLSYCWGPTKSLQRTRRHSDGWKWPR